MSGTKADLPHSSTGAPKAGGSDEHATNPLVASYDVIDFLTTIAFVSATLANSVSPVLPIISSVMHILNYGLLTYIQAKGLRELTLVQKNNIEQVLTMPGTIPDSETLETAKSEFLLPKKGNKSNAQFAWDLAMYILKMMACLLLVAISILGFTALAAYASAVLLPIGYIITCAVNVLKFGKNTLTGIYNYFLKGCIADKSAYQKNHLIVDSLEKELKSDRKKVVSRTPKEFNEYLEARNAINKAGRDNILNTILLGLSATFLAASILILLAPPLGITIASALFTTAGVLFAVHGISVLANVIRKKRGLPEKSTFFGWITEKLYPTVTANSYELRNLSVNDEPRKMPGSTNTIAGACSQGKSQAPKRTSSDPIDIPTPKKYRNDDHYGNSKSQSYSLFNKSGLRDLSKNIPRTLPRDTPRFA